MLHLLASILDRHSRGFTLIETLIVVLLMGIAAMLAVPAVNNTVIESKLDGAAAWVAGDMRYAQNLAIQMQLPHSVIFDPATESYRLANQGGTTVQHPWTKQPYQVSFATGRWQGVDLLSTTFPGGTNTVTFDSFGSPQSAGIVTLRLTGKQRLISVNFPTGRVVYQ